MAGPYMSCRRPNPVALAVGLPDAPILTARSAKDTGLVFLELNCPNRNAGMTGAVCENAFLIALQIRKASDFDLYADGKSIAPSGFDAGTVALFDLRMNLATDLRDPFHAVNLYIPLKALIKMGDDGDIPRHIQELRHTVGSTVDDAVIRHLLSSMRPALARPAETSELFVDFVAMALSVHLSNTYGNVAQLPRQWGGGLPPWQERLATQMIDANIDGNVTLGELAKVCGLSKRHFTRAFRQSMGMPPHQWLQHRRIDKAKQMLTRPEVSISTIALECGFADQSHLTRIFTRLIGRSPGEWRRIKLD
ncbi:AraC family transcriptional regulator [Ochrobactrum sp. 19YEA23]|uniref:helix-turn-helix domain-containing protein n=1 Tax=Ochrobactrum sp. 19YEA23 TaxID=3039854 RepID=UPI00247AD186|nr:AraC family transcriptional regulator [Ochrobactrum sp. 19YEA23]